MRTHVDWLTFTMPMIYFGDQTGDYATAIEHGFLDMFGNELLSKAFGGEWSKNERSRAPYTDAWKINNGSITLFASPTLTHCCVEISGQGCETLIAKGLLDQVLQSCHSRTTRIDIACDMETTIRPTEFVEKVNHERMRTSGQVISDTGETCYVGSQKSERYARVYRYNAPHPRAHLLRVEHVFRKDYAKKVAAECANVSLDAIARSAGLAFGWAHPVWETTILDSPDISITRERGNAGSTVFWLVNSVAPAFKRLCETGGIQDPEKFLRTYFLSETD